MDGYSRGYSAVLTHLQAGRDGPHERREPPRLGLLGLRVEDVRLEHLRARCVCSFGAPVRSSGCLFASAVAVHGVWLFVSLRVQLVGLFVCLFLFV